MAFKDEEKLPNIPKDYRKWICLKNKCSSEISIYMFVFEFFEVEFLLQFHLLGKIGHLKTFFYFLVVTFLTVCDCINIRYWCAQYIVYSIGMLCDHTTDINQYKNRSFYCCIIHNSLTSGA